VENESSDCLQIVRKTKGYGYFTNVKRESQFLFKKNYNFVQKTKKKQMLREIPL